MNSTLFFYVTSLKFNLFLTSKLILKNIIFPNQVKYSVIRRFLELGITVKEFEVVVAFDFKIVAGEGFAFAIKVDTLNSFKLIYLFSMKIFYK